MMVQHWNVVTKSGNISAMSYTPKVRSIELTRAGLKYTDLGIAHWLVRSLALASQSMVGIGSMFSRQFVTLISSR